MLPEKKTEFADQLQQLLNEFSACFKDFKSHKHLFEIFSSPFHTEIEKAPMDIQMELIDLQERTDLKVKYVEMDHGDFYRKYLDQEKFPSLRKFMASKIALLGSTCKIAHVWTIFFWNGFHEISLSISNDRQTLEKWA